jgi:glycosyltransferase involved in cell wall biosynthesis
MNLRGYLAPSGAALRGGPETGRPTNAMTEQFPQIIVATILRRVGSTGVHTHVRELEAYTAARGEPCHVVTPFSRRPAIASAVFAPRLPLERLSGAAGVRWYRHWHGLFLESALRSTLSSMADVVVYAQGPEAARAALRARRGPSQRVVLAVHFQASQADGWVDKRLISRGSRTFEAIRAMEREVIPRVDGIVFVSESARRHLLAWLPEAAGVPYQVVHNFVAPAPTADDRERLGDLVSIGSLDPTKNHEFLLRVVSEAKRRGKYLTLDIFGAGPSRKDLEQLARLLEVSEQIRLRGVRLDVRQWLPRYRVYVHASRTETGPLAIIEALAAGLPVIAAKLGGISELYNDGVEGRFWSLGDVPRATTTLLDLLGSEQLYLETAL